MPDASSSPPVVLVDKPAPHVARLRINRPDKRNAIDFATRCALIEALRGLLAAADCRAVVFGGVDGVLSSGGDISSMGGLSEAAARERMRHVHELCRLLASGGLPIVTAIEGVGAGGGAGIAMLSDYVVAGPGSKILFPFLKLGLTPDWGLLYSLPRRIGATRAIQLLSSGRFIEGEEAYRLGLADELVADSEIMNAAIARAAEFARLPAGAFAKMKARLATPSASLEEELRREENDQAVCLLGDEFREGYSAFMEKRAADFLKIPREGD